MARMNGGQIIVDYLVQENVAHAFGLCGHGNISFIDALYERSAEITSLFRPPRVGGRIHGGRLLPGCRPSGRDVYLLRPRLRQYSRMSCERLLRLGSLPRHYRKRPHEPVQPRRLSGNLPPLPSGFSLGREALLQARVPAHAGRASSSLHAPGVENHGHRPPRTGRARCAVRYFQGRS